MKNLIKKHLASRGEMTKDDNILGEVIVPYLLLDAMNVLMVDKIRPLPIKHKAKMCYKHWVCAYNAYNKSFFSAFTDEEQMVFVAMMDDFNETIKADMDELKGLFVEKYAHYSPALQQDLAIIMCCNVLAQAAHHQYKNFRRGKTNPEISRCVKWSFEFMLEWAKQESEPTGDINLHSFPDLHDKVQELCETVKGFSRSKLGVVSDEN